MTETKKYQGENHHGADHSSPYPVSRMATAVTLVDMAREIEHADAMVNTRASAKLQLIAQQIKQLQEEARQTLEQAQRDQQLHHATCNFKRIPGKTYHLYKREDGVCYFSMLSPLDWNHASPTEFIASYKLENDLSWTAVIV